MNRDAAYEAIADRVRDAIADAVKGSEFAPDAAAVLIDAVVIMGWHELNGAWTQTSIHCGSPWSARALVERHHSDVEDDYLVETLGSVDDGDSDGDADL